MAAAPIPEAEWEIRVKTTENIGTPWEAIEPEVDRGTRAEMTEWAQDVVRCFNVFEIRLNEVGSLQGHYIAGAKARA